MKKWLLIMLASFSSVVSAENESLDCKNAMNTFEINQCASMALDSAQAELTKYLEASFEHNANDPDLVSAIQVAQKDWQSYSLLIAIRYIHNGGMVQFVVFWRYLAKRS